MRELPRAVERLLLLLLAKDPAGRPASARDVAAALAALEAEFQRPRRPRWRLALDGAALLLLLVLGSVVALALSWYLHGEDGVVLPTTDTCGERGERP